MTNIAPSVEDVKRFTGELQSCTTPDEALCLTASMIHAVVVFTSAIASTEDAETIIKTFTEVSFSVLRE